MRTLWMCLAVAVVPAINAEETGVQLKLLGTLDGSRPEAFYSMIAFSPDGKLLACSNDESIMLWDVEKRKLCVTLEGRTYSLAFSPDGKTLASGGSDNAIQLWDMAARKAKASLKGHTSEIRSVAFSPDGKTLVSGGGRGSDAGEMKLWNLATGKEKASFKGNPGPVFTVVFSPDGKRIASGSGDFASNGTPGGGEVKIWDAATGKEKSSLKSRGGKDGPGLIWSLSFSPDGKTIASGDVYGWVLLWDVESGKRKATLQAFKPGGKDSDINGAYSVAISPDGKTLAAGTLRGMKLWDLNTGKQVEGLKLPAAAAWAVAFSPDGKTLAAAEGTVKNELGELKDTTIRLWEFMPAKKAEK